jgi:hypothetical protein
MRRSQIVLFAAAGALTLTSCSHSAIKAPVMPLHQELAAQFEGEMIAGIATLAAPHLLVRKFDQLPGLTEALAGNPRAAKNPVLNHAKRIEAFGSAFDTVEEWAKIGVDPNGGISVIAHREMFGVVVAKVTDLGKLLALAERAGAGTAIVQSNEGGVTRFTLGERAGLMIDLGGRSALVTGEKGLTYDPAKLKRELTQPVKPLAERQGWKLLAPTAAVHFNMVSDAEVALHSLEDVDSKLKVLKFLRGFGLWASDDLSSISLWVGEKLKAAMPLITGAHRSLPAVANPLLAKDHVAFRMRLGLPTLVEGLKILVPGKAKEIMGGIGRANQLLNQMGLSVKMLTEGLSGDIIVGFPASAINPKNPKASDITQVVAVLAANDQKVLEKIIQRLAVVAMAMGGKELTIGGRPALHLPAGRMPAYVVLADGGLVIGLSPEVIEARLKTVAKVAATVTAAPNTVLGLYIDSTRIAARIADDAIAQAKAEMKAVGAVQSPKLEAKRAAAQFGKRFARLDSSLADHGELVVGSGSAMMAITGIGVMAMIAIPNFVKFSCRAKQSEAKSNLKAGFQAQMSLFAEYGEFGSIKNSGFQPEPINRYTYCFNATDCLPCDPKVAGCSETVAAARAACSSAFYSSENGGDFKLCAAGNIDSDRKDLDIWTIDRSNAVINVKNDCR